MNSGLVEASDLAGLMGSAIAGQDSASLLETYQRTHMRNWREVLGLGETLQPMASTDPWVAANAPALLACLPAIGSELAGMARQLDLEFAVPAARG